MKSVVLKSVGVASVAAAVAAVAIAGAGPAAAAKKPPKPLKVAYDAAGTTKILKPNATVKLGPTTLSASLSADGSFTGSLPIPPAPAMFNALGFVPTSATVNFIPVGDVTGKLVTSGSTSTVQATAVYNIQLTNVKILGIDSGAGNSCTTKAPVTIPVSTPAGQSFSVTDGGTVTGTYTLGEFQNCGITTGLINLLVPGPNNTVSFTLTNGRIG